MENSRLTIRLTFTFIVVLIAIVGVSAGWYAAIASRTNAFWHVDPLDHTTLDRTIAIDGYRVLLSISRRQNRHGIMDGRKGFSVEIWHTHTKNKSSLSHNCYFSFSPKSVYGLSMVTISIGPMFHGANTWIGYGMTGKFCIKFNRATSEEYYRINNRWVAFKDVRQILTEGHPPVLIWHNINYYFNPYDGCWNHK
jgi:hypothetical protein